MSTAEATDAATRVELLQRSSPAQPLGSFVSPITDVIAAKASSIP
ncbi:hypothetical protein DEI99_006645 [Curtobacterium sp. MCLR17_036]|nr:hypothetical protein [Curtobacterium sp. MCLR17_036]WIE66206.1 hypothetical protein DEI99_006645 [Curtobacterium sp. MCLR17_036]